MSSSSSSSSSLVMSGLTSLLMLMLLGNHGQIHQFITSVCACVCELLNNLVVELVALTNETSHTDRQ